MNRRFPSDFFFPQKEQTGSRAERARAALDAGRPPRKSPLNSGNSRTSVWSYPASTRPCIAWSLPASHSA
jgi:hypothetical protein